MRFIILTYFTIRMFFINKTMAETRSKAAKKRNANPSFISNLATNVKKGKICSPDDSQYYLSGIKQCNSPEKSPRKTCTFKTQSVQSSTNKKAIHTNNAGDNVKDSLLEEDPICSDGEIEMPDQSEEEKFEETSTTMKGKINYEELFSEGSAIAKDESISVPHKPKKSQITSYIDENQTKAEKSVNYGTNKIEYKILFDKDQGCSSYLEGATSDSNDSLGLGDATSEKISDSLPRNINSESSDAKMIFKGYGDLVKVVEEIKHINLIVKKIQEELQKCIK